MNNTDLYIEYDDIIIGKRKNFSGRFFGKDNLRSSENALEVIRYAFTRYLGWAPDVLELHLDKALMKKLHLNILMRYIDYPIDYNKDKDYFYLVSLVYSRKRVDIRSKTIHVYEKILSGEQTKYPKGYFNGSSGIVKAGICFQYMLEHFISFSDMNDLYFLFSTHEGVSLLKEYKLYSVYTEIFDTPVDFLHFSLPEQQKNNVLFSFYKFMYLYNQTSGNKKKTDYKLQY